MPSVVNREGFKNWCLRQLGHPVVKINIDDDQLEDCVDLAFQYWRDFHADAVNRTYVKHLLTNDDKTNQYIDLPDEILSVNRIFNKYDMGGNSTNMFDIQYQMHLNDISFMRPGTTGEVTTYVMSRQYLDMLDMLFNGQIPIRFNRHTNKLFIDWDWENDAVAGQYIIIECVTALDPNEYPDVWNDRMLKSLATSYIKKQWGTNMKKYEGVALLGGVKMNGQQIYNEALQEIATTEDLIRTTYEEPPMFIML